MLLKESILKPPDAEHEEDGDELRGPTSTAHAENFRIVTDTFAAHISIDRNTNIETPNKGGKSETLNGFVTKHTVQHQHHEQFATIVNIGSQYGTVQQKEVQERTLYPSCVCNSTSRAPAFHRSTPGPAILGN